MPGSAAARLTASGHDVVQAAATMPGADVIAVLTAVRAQGRILITFDAVLGELVFRHGHAAPPGIAYLSHHPIDGATAADLAEVALAAGTAGQFVVVDARSVRRRAVPAAAPR